jgi:hypothetical protein
MSRFLIETDRSHWREPSQRRCLSGAENRTWFRITARTSDGALFWRGWFEGRDDLDAFLWALASGSLRYERALWGLPQAGSGRPCVGWCSRLEVARYEGAWQGEWADLPLMYDFATQRLLVSPTGSLQTDIVPSDWNSANNSIQTIGAGGSGAAVDTNGNRNVTGGGGGAWNRAVNVALTRGASASYQIGAGGAAVTQATAGASAGNAGGDTWYNGSTLGGSNVGSKGGAGGQVATNGGAGGDGPSGIGSSNNSGGRGGNSTNVSGQNATGGGGAGGPHGAGSNGGDATGINVATAGGSGDAGSGGAGGANTGGAGTEFDATHGSGGGGGGKRSAPSAGPGGVYGAGGGGNCSLTTAISGAGANGLIVQTYTPVALFRQNPLTGLSAGGAFFADPLSTRARR